MERKMVIKLLGIGVAVLIVAIATYVIFRPNEQQTSSQSEETVAAKTPASTVKTYTDSAGFSFSYPEDVTVSKKDINDQITYANVELTSSTVEGNMSFIAQDTKIKSLDEWLSKIVKSTSSAATKEVTLDNLPARQVTTRDKITTAVLDQGILFTIEVLVKTEKDYWTSVYNTVLSSFSFVAPQSSAASSTGEESSDEVVFEGEETVE